MGKKSGVAHFAVGADGQAPPLQRQGEDLEIAFAGEDYGQEAAVGGDVEFADGDAAEDWLRCWREDGNVVAGFLRGELGNINPD